MATISIKLKDSEILKIDYLVKQGIYENRTQAVEELLRTSLSQQSIYLEEEPDERVEEIRKKLYKRWNLQENFVLKTRGHKSLVDTVFFFFYQ